MEELAVMKIREILMEYFKGTCVESFVNAPTIAFIEIGRPRGTYQYQRIAQQNEQFSGIYISGSQFLTVQHYPDKVTFNELVCSRSPEFKKIYKEVDKFLGDYLPAVKVEVNNGNVY